MMNLQQCIWCKALFQDEGGPTHAYMESSPGCWAAFGRVLAREYSDQRLQRVHRLTVDSYAVQHPGIPSPQSIQSVGVHLVRLCLFLERDLAPEAANDAMLAAARFKSGYVWLDPPASLGAITIADLDAAPDVDSHLATMQAWAKQMWNVWSDHHEIVRNWADGRAG